MHKAKGASSHYIIKSTFNSDTVWRSKLHYFKQNYTTMKTYLWTTWSSIRLLLGWLQVNSVTRAHHAVYANWLQPFERCVTGISIYFHSGRHYRCSVPLRYLRNSKWEVHMVTFPLLSNVRQKAMITPVSPLLTMLVHIDPSYWKIYNSFEIILEMGAVH